MKTLSYLLFGILFLCNNSIAQEVDINKSILEIRKKYGIIVNKEIKDLKIDTVDLSWHPTPEEMAEGSASSTNKYIIHHNSIDTFLIKNIHFQDEGGAYSSCIKSVFFWDDLPFFYFEEAEGLWEGIKKETRIYIKDNKVIRKLYKEAQFFSSEVGAIQVSMDTIPNQTMTFDNTDIQNVSDFISWSKYELSKKR
jgi:hypothetical protein